MVNDVSGCLSCDPLLSAENQLGGAARNHVGRRVCPGPVMICGITEASATRKPKMPWTRSSGRAERSMLVTPSLRDELTACPSKRRGKLEVLDHCLGACLGLE